MPPISTRSCAKCCEAVVAIPRGLQSRASVSSDKSERAAYYEKLWRYRLRVGAVIAEAREKFLAAMHSDSNVFTWYNEEFWVDRVRWLVLPMSHLGTKATGHTLQDDGEGGDVNDALVMYGGSSRMNWSHELTRVLGAMLAGTTERHFWDMSGAHLLNLAVVQPMVNPPFGPLFWLALAEDAPGPADNLYTTLTPMMFDMTAYPTRVPDPQDIRRAQGEFLMQLTGGIAGGDAERYSANDWLRLCSWQLHAQYHLMGRLFVDVESRVIQAEIEVRDNPR
jgi:hypothetical protein